MTKVFSLVGALAVLGALLFATSALAAPKEAPRGATGATGPTGPAGANGTNGEKGATGPTGPVESALGINQAACKAGTPVAECTLASGYQETGVWSVHISAPTGAPQQQYVSPISFPVRLKKGDLVKAVYRTSAQVEAPSAPCLGSSLEPRAEAGNLCVYRGIGLHGGLETEDRNATFFGFVNTNGENETVIGKVEPLGVGVVFRSVNNSPVFTEEPAEEPAVITERAYMEGIGAWAVTEK
jgi:hypothetical protein